jgi:hypothetical protein
MPPMRPIARIEAKARTVRSALPEMLPGATSGLTMNSSRVAGQMARNSAGMDVQTARRRMVSGPYAGPTASARRRGRLGPQQPQGAG